MFTIFYDPTTGKALGLARLRRETPDWMGDAGTHLGIPGRRARRLNATEARMAFGGIRRFVENTGYPVTVETNQREANALLAYGLVSSGSGTYRLVPSGAGTHVSILSGHGTA